MHIRLWDIWWGWKEVSVEMGESFWRWQDIKQSQRQEQVQIRSDNREAFVRTSTLTATAGACLSLEEASLRRSWSEKVRARSRKRSGHENCSCPDL